MNQAKKVVQYPGSNEETDFTKFQKRKLVEAMELMQEVTECDRKKAFFTVASTNALNEVYRAYPFYDYVVTPFVIQYKGIEITCFYVDATYNPKLVQSTY